MSKPDRDRERTIAEQWWPGLLFWVLAVIIFGIIINSKSCGAEISMAWDSAPGGPEVTQWRVYRISPGPRVQIGITDQPFITLDANEGDRLVVTAENSDGESADSVVWVVRLPMPDPVARVTIQVSDDMTEWEDFQSFDLRESKAKFYRLKIEKP